MGWELHLTDLEQGEKTERNFEQASVRIGRNADNELALKHEQVSRVHLTLSKQGDRYFAEDSSRNGSFVLDGKHWQKVVGRAELQLPATVRLAHWIIRIEYTADPSWDQSVMMPAGALVSRNEGILVFDLCESSRIASEDDVMAYHLKQRITQLADPVLAENRMRFFKGTGDGFLATFPDAEDAVTAALEIENRIKLRNSRTNNLPIQYRLAVHFGETWGITAGREDIHGNDVNIAFRIEGAQVEAFPDLKTQFPQRDRILCSAHALDEIKRKNTVLPPQIEGIYCGQANLKGITEAVGIYWLKAA